MVIVNVVEGEGFEPSVRYRTPAFQASKLNRSDIPPKLVVLPNFHPRICI